MFTIMYFDSKRSHNVKGNKMDKMNKIDKSNNENRNKSKIIK